MNTFESVLAVVLMMGGTWWVCEWTWQRVIRRKERSRAAITDREHRNSLARVLGGERRELSERVKRDMAQRGYTAHSFHFPAESQAREKPAERLDTNSGYPSETVRLRMQPKGDAA